jgi:hypothetical protein
MTRESLESEPVLDDEIVEQNLDLMEEKFPECLVEEWTGSIVPLITEMIEKTSTLSDDTLRLNAHKCAGSTLQIGGHQLGSALRTVSHLVQGGQRDAALGIIEDLPGYLTAFKDAMSEGS